MTSPTAECSESPLPTSTIDLLTRIQNARTQVENAIVGLNTATLTQPGVAGWSIKDHLAHIMTWAQLSLLAHLHGQTFAEAANLSLSDADTLARQGTDVMNTFFIARNRDCSLEDVLRPFHQSYLDLRSAVAALGDAALHAAWNLYAQKLTYW